MAGSKSKRCPVCLVLFWSAFDASSACCGPLLSLTLTHSLSLSFFLSGSHSLSLSAGLHRRSTLMVFSVPCNTTLNLDLTSHGPSVRPLPVSTCAQSTPYIRQSPSFQESFFLFYFFSSSCLLNFFV
ncbi:hypothetical protein V8C42DRAFT_198314 [Trichoderma barbatum]